MSNVDQQRARKILQRLYYLPHLYVLSVEELIAQLRQEGYEWPAAIFSSLPPSIVELRAKLEKIAAVLNAAELHSFSVISSSPVDFGRHLTLMRDSGQLSVRHVAALASEAGMRRLYKSALRQDDNL